MSVTPAWAIAGRKLSATGKHCDRAHHQNKIAEMPDDNDTSAGREYGSRGASRDILQRDRVLQGVRRLVQPILHTPSHTGGEQMKNMLTNSLYKECPA